MDSTILNLYLARYGVPFDTLSAKGLLPVNDTAGLIKLAKAMCTRAYKNQQAPFGTGRKNHRNMASIIGRSLGTSVVLGEVDKSTHATLRGQWGRWFDVLCPCGEVFPLPLAKINNAPRLCPTCEASIDPTQPKALGKQYGRLTIIGNSSDDRKLLCRCLCGTEVEVFRSALSSGRTKSCGCLRSKKRNV